MDKQQRVRAIQAALDLWRKKKVSPREAIAVKYGVSINELDDLPLSGLGEATQRRAAETWRAQVQWNAEYQARLAREPDFMQRMEIAVAWEDPDGVQL